jgi:hypothetical protein
MPDLFRAYQVRDVRIPTYLIESSAPINVDDSPSPQALPDRLTPLDAQEAIDQIAGHLRTVDSANLVVMVHRFNKPRTGRSAMVCARLLNRRAGLRYSMHHPGNPG